MDIAGIQFPRTVQEILHDYQQGILKSETSEQPGERRTPGGTSGLSDPRKRGTNVAAATPEGRLVPRPSSGRRG